MENVCENCPHEGNIEEQDCFCEMLYSDLLREDYLQKLDLLGITEAEVENGIWKSETATIPLATIEAQAPSAQTAEQQK